MIELSNDNSAIISLIFDRTMNENHEGIILTRLTNNYNRDLIGEILNMNFG